jgi:hypothetical protein
MLLKAMNFKIIVMKIETDGMTRRFWRYLLDLMALGSAILCRHEVHDIREAGSLQYLQFRYETVCVSLHIGNHQSTKRLNEIGI